ANANYQGGPLGNLHAGSNGKHLEQLVGKWFLGKDHPQTSGDGITYQLAHGTLFGKTISYEDVQQGKAGDCYFLASLAETALKSPDAVKHLFVDNGDGTYTVRFHH